MGEVQMKMNHHLNTDNNNIDPIYYKLAAYLDKMPAGFPATKSGVEIRILRRFFDPDEAAFALHVTLIPEEARVIARRAKITRGEAELRLETMAKKGLIYSMESDGKPTTYMSNQLVIGIWEYHVNDLDLELINDMNEYIPTLMQEAWKVPQLRTIPVDKSITPPMEISTYENAEELIMHQKNIAVAPCICRREKSLVGEGCQAPEDVCLVFGSAADYYQRNGLGRIIDHQEALDILKKADEAGLVIQPSNAQKVANICFCCGCCCAVLRTIKKYPKPAELISSPFYVVPDPESCDGCGICITIEDDQSAVNRDRCIGCGLCVTTCPTDSLHLVRKPDKELPSVPKNNIEKYIQLGRSRGKLSSSEIVMMQVKSKVDRLLASKE
jgi:hypothetical protein